MRKDAFLSQTGYVKSKMRDTEGFRVTTAEYARMVDIWKTKGFDIPSNMTIAPIKEFDADVSIEYEKDVEDYILVPLLKRLGWDTEIRKRMCVRMGRGETYIADYVVMPDDTPGRESAYWVWEAKKSIKNKKELERDYGQALSYAKRLTSEGLSLISKEGIWYGLKKDEYELTFISYSNLKDPDVFSKLYKIMGKRKGRKKKSA